MKSKSQQTGVSLLELMIVVALVGILLAWGGPAWRSAISRDAITTATNRFLMAIRDARDIAQDTGAGANLVATAPTAANEWGEGWTLRDPTQVPPNDLIEVYGRLPAGITLDAQAGENTINFGANGIRNGVANSIFNVCDSGVNGEIGRQITVSVLGRAEITNRAFVCP